MPWDADSRRGWLLLLASLLVCFGVWHWADSLLIPRSTRVALAGGKPIGNNSDLYPRWLGARALLLHGQNPYSAEVTRDIQVGFYGRPLDHSKATDPVDEQAFAYPLYVVFLMAPCMWLPFSVVMKVFGWLLLACTAASVLLWMQALGLRFRTKGQIAVILLVIGAYPVLQGFYKQQLTLLVGFLLAAAAALLARRQLAWGGVLLALATIKPQISALLIFWLMLWAFGDWRKRRALIFSFAGTLAVLLIASEILLPGWMRDFVTALRAYQNYAADRPILEQLLTPPGGKIVAALLAIIFVAICWRWRKEQGESLRFAWATALALALNLTILNKIAPYNEVLLVPALLLLPLLRKSARMAARAVSKAAYACLIWHWGSATVLAACSLMISAERLEWAAQLPLYTVFALTPMTLLALLLNVPPEVAASGSGR